MVGYFAVVANPRKVGLQLHALHKGESSAKAGDKFLCAALHIGSDIFAVGAGIGQKPFFIKGLRIVKGLFRRKPIQTVCFPLQGGEVKQFRRACFLFLFNICILLLCFVKKTKRQIIKICLSPLSYLSLHVIRPFVRS